MGATGSGRQASPYHSLLEAQIDRFTDIEHWRRQRLSQARADYERAIQIAEERLAADIARTEKAVEDWRTILRRLNAEVCVMGYPKESTPELRALASQRQGPSAIDYAVAGAEILAEAVRERVGVRA